MNATAEQLGFVRLCPSCGSERPVEEMRCEALLAHGDVCDWWLAEVEIRAAGELSSGSENEPVAAARVCVNGHPLEVGDELCMVCGGTVASESRTTDERRSSATGGEPTVVGGWSVERRFSSGAPRQPWERFVVSNGQRRGVLTLYDAGHEPDPTVHAVLQRMPRDHVPELIATGRFADRAYEIVELIDGGDLAQAGWFAADDPQVLRRIVDELGRALSAFAEAGLRHRDLCPTSVLLRTRDPLDLVVTGFGSARLADFDLEAVAPLEITRYSAPETIVGAVTAASDWWSLGMLVLEQATRGLCFEGVNEQAFRLHVVTRGVPIPAELNSDVRSLLLGLLTRDPLRRWGAKEVQAWLAGEATPPTDDAALATATAGPSIRLAGREFQRSEAFGLAAAEAGNWEEAKILSLGGSIATWLLERGSEPHVEAEVRRIAS